MVSASILVTCTNTACFALGIELKGFFGSKNCIVLILTEENIPFLNQVVAIPILCLIP